MRCSNHPGPPSAVPEAIGLKTLPDVSLRVRSPRPRDVRCSGWWRDVDLVDAFDHVAYVGPEGSGRTHLMRRIARLLMDRARGSTGPASVPLSLGLSLEDAGITLASPLARPWELRALLSRNPFAATAWEAGTAVLLIDGSACDAGTSVAAARHFRDAWPALRTVVAAASEAQPALRALGFHVAALEPFGPDDLPPPPGNGPWREPLSSPWEAGWSHTLNHRGGRIELYQLIRDSFGADLRTGHAPARVCTALEAHALLASSGRPERSLDRLSTLAGAPEDLTSAGEVFAEAVSTRANQASIVARSARHAEHGIRRSGATPRGLAALSVVAGSCLVDPGGRSRGGTTDVARMVQVTLLARHLAEVLDGSAAALGGPVRILVEDLLGVIGDPRVPRDALQALLPVPGHGALSRTPVTVAQFEPFVNSGAYARDAIPARAHAGRGPGNGGPRTCPDDWSRQLRRPSWPVTGVSWYEAAAFAAWLGSRHPTRRFSLATSTAWEAAAGTGSQPYPWGHAPPHGTLLNFDRQVGRRTPVTAHPRGAGRYGHLDLSGNVWEWCAERTPSGGTVRGGGWYTTGHYVTNSYHYAFHPENRFEDLGFRIQAHEAHECTPSASRRNDR